MRSFFQRGMERCDQRMWQITDETDGIRQHKLRAFANIETTGRRIKRCKQLVSREGLRLGQRIEQRGFASVGIAHQRHRKHSAALTPAPTHVALFLYFLQSLLECAHTTTEQAAVCFELSFPRPSQTDTAFLTFKVRPPSHQPRGQVFKLSELNLNLAFMALRTLRKDIEYQGRAVNDATAQRMFKVTLLGRRQCVVEHDEIRIMRLERDFNLIDFSTPGEQRRVRPNAATANDCLNTCAGRIHQQPQLFKTIGEHALSQIELDEYGTLAGVRPFKHQDLNVSSWARTIALMPPCYHCLAN